MIDPGLVRSTFVAPALSRLGLYSLDAERLLMGTAAIESNFTNFVQFGGGPARGMFQMEPPTYFDIMDRVLGDDRRADLLAAVTAMATSETPGFLQLTSNHLFAAALARAKYYSVSPPIPSSLDDQAAYWSRYYNGRSPHGLKPADYVNTWNQYCAPLYD